MKQNFRLDDLVAVLLFLLCVIVVMVFLFGTPHEANAQTFQKQQNETYHIQWQNAYEKDGELFPYEEGIEFIVYEQTPERISTDQRADTLSKEYICVQDASYWVQAVDQNNNKSTNSDTVFVEMTDEIIPPETEEIPVQFRTTQMLDWTGNLQQDSYGGILYALDFISNRFTVTGGTYLIEFYFVGKVDFAFGAESDTLTRLNRFEEPYQKEYHVDAGDRLLYILAITDTQFRYGEDDWILRITKVEPSVELYPPASIWVQ